MACRQIRKSGRHKSTRSDAQCAVKWWNHFIPRPCLLGRRRFSWSKRSGDFQMFVCEYSVCEYVYFLGEYIHVYERVYVSMCNCGDIYMCVCVRVCVCVSVSVSVYVCVCICIYIHTYTYICMYICIYMCVCVYGGGCAYVRPSMHPSMPSLSYE